MELSESLVRYLKKATLAKNIIRNSRMWNDPLGTALQEVHEKNGNVIDKTKNDLKILRKRDKMFKELIDEFLADRKAFVDKYQ